MARVGTEHRAPRDVGPGGGGPGSLVDEVGRQVRAASAELPVPELRAARLRLGQASLQLGQVLDAASTAWAVPTLRAAGEHLDLATGALLRAQDALAEYLQMIGLPPGDRTAPPALSTTTPGAVRSADRSRRDRPGHEQGRPDQGPPRNDRPPHNDRALRNERPPRNDRAPGRDRARNERPAPPHVDLPHNERSASRSSDHPRNDRDRPVSGVVGNAGEDGDVPMGAG